MKNVPIYMHQAFDKDLTKLIKKFDKVTIHLNYDTIVGTGLSGALVVPAIGRALGVKWAIVRKPTENSHDQLFNSKAQYVGEIGHNWIFVDDFIATGETLHRVKDTIGEEAYEADERPHYVGTYMYEDDHFILP